MSAETEVKSIQERLVSALQEDEFVLYAQGISSLDGADDWPFQEIFVRFKEEDAKLIPPGSFLPLLEECHLLPFLDRWVVNRLARWVRSGLAIKPEWKIPRSNVNLSPATLLDSDFGRYVRKYVDDSYLTGVLAFEITWNDVTTHAQAVRALMEELKPFGCGFTLAGFEGGKGAYTFLEAARPDFVKINPSITRDVDSSAPHAQKVLEICQRCNALGIKAIAEQVESKPVLEHLRKTGIHFAQGYGVAGVELL
jgi:EAL domain-containing protein (putative c-di-GMP-specific phosphodiesterase class I)